MPTFYKKTHKLTYAGTKLMKWYKETKPFCEACFREPTTDAHHICTEGSGGPTQISNLLALCRVCHTIMHAGGWRKACDRFPHLAGKIVAARVSMGRKT